VRAAKTCEQIVNVATERENIYFEHLQFSEVTDEIKLLKEMIVDNGKRIRELQQRNAQLKGTIEQLREKRRDIVFVGVHVKE
jgi:hypothetical protein